MNIIGSLKNGGLRPELEDDVLSGLDVGSLNEVKFFSRLQIRGRIIHSQAYKRVCVRNSYTISYRDGEQMKYGQVEVFVQAPRGSIKHAAVVLPFEESKGFICPTHQVLDVSPVVHIIGWNPPLNNQCVLVPLDNIEDICVSMDFKDTGIFYVAHFPNNIERD